MPFRIILLFYISCVLLLTSETSLYAVNTSTVIGQPELRAGNRCFNGPAYSGDCPDETSSVPDLKDHPALPGPCSEIEAAVYKSQNMAMAGMRGLPLK